MVVNFPKGRCVGACVGYFFYYPYSPKGRSEAQTTPYEVF